MTPQWLLLAMNQSCDILERQPSGVDEYGNPTYVTTFVASSRCLLQPVSQTDLQLGRAAVGTYTLFLPDTAQGQVSAFSVFVINTNSYECEGPPAMYRQLFETGPVHHIEVNVSRSTA